MTFVDDTTTQRDGRCHAPKQFVTPVPPE